MKEFWQGASRALGIVAGFLPTAVGFGAIAIQAGIDLPTTLSMSIWIFAGASQFAAVEAVRQGLPWLSIVLTVWVINLRHIPMSLAAVRKIYRHFGRPQQWLLSHGLVDETFALELSEPLRPFSYYLGMHLCCWLAWVAGTWMGSRLGMQIPERWLQFALPALFLYLLIHSVQRVWSRAIALVLGIGTALVLATLGLGSTGILLSILGVAVVASLVLGVDHNPEEHA